MTLEQKCEYFTVTRKAPTWHQRLPQPFAEQRRDQSLFQVLLSLCPFFRMDIAWFAKKESKRTGKKNEPLVKNIVLPVYFAISHSSDECLVIILSSQMEAVTKKGSHNTIWRQSQQSGKETKVTCPDAIVLLASQTNQYPSRIYMCMTLLDPWKNRRSLGLNHTLRKLSMTQSATFVRTRNLCDQMPLVSFVFYFLIVP